MNLHIVGYILLIVGGLGHLLPDVLMPILSIGFGEFITVQRLIGLLSVVTGVFLLVKK